MENQQLIMVLRTVINQADAKGKPCKLYFKIPKKSELDPNYINLDVNKLMQNIGSPQFDYDTLVAARNSDPRIKAMISNFDDSSMELKTQSVSLTGATGDEQGGDTVAQMAKSATNLGDNL